MWPKIAVKVTLHRLILLRDECIKLTFIACAPRSNPSIGTIFETVLNLGVCFGGKCSMCINKENETMSKAFVRPKEGLFLGFYCVLLYVNQDRFTPFKGKGLGTKMKNELKEQFFDPPVCYTCSFWNFKQYTSA